MTASSVQINAEKGEISGTVHSKNWVEREASFVVRISEPIAQVITLPARSKDKAPRYLLNFDLGRGRELQARVAMSTCDVAGAQRNFEAEADKFFDRVREDALAEWAQMLGRIQIEAPDRQKRTFYSALNRVFMHPSDIADVDGLGPRDPR